MDHAGLAPANGGWQWFNFFWARGAHAAARPEPVATAERHYYEAWLGPVCQSNLQLDCNVRVFEWFDTSTSAVLRDLDESNRFVQTSAASTSM